MKLSCLGLCLLVGTAAGCSSSVATDGGDAGVPHGDGGAVDAGCAVTGALCDPVLAPCCNAGDQCLLSSTLGPTCGLVDAGLDAGLPDASSPDSGPDGGIPDSGLADAGGPDAGPPPDSGPLLWVPQSIPGDVTALFGLAVPDPGIVLAVGRNQDGGLLLEGSGAPDAAFAEVPGLPDSQVLSGVWSDPSAAVVVAVGRTSQGEALLEGSLGDGGAFQSIPAQWAALGLLQCWGDVLGDLYAVGLGSGGALLLLEPAGGSFAPETLPVGLATVFRITGAPGGAEVYALAVDNLGQSQVLVRIGGVWTELSGLPSGVHFADLALASDGTLVLVGDDGAGGGVGYIATPDGGGLAPLGMPSVPFVPSVHAVAVAGGDIYLGAGASPPAVFHCSDGGWSEEALPFGTSTLTQLAGDGTGALYAVGSAGVGGILLKRSP